jgi:hypothetical protein
MNELQKIDDVLNALHDAREAFAEFAEKNPGIVELRQRWLNEPQVKTSLQLPTPAREEWRKREPGLDTLPAVIAARKRVADAKTELQAAEGELTLLERDSTPLKAYIDAITVAESLVNPIAAMVAKERLKTVLQTQYGVDDPSRLPSAVVKAARAHSSVYAVESLKFNPRLAVVRNLTETELESADSRAVEALAKVRDVLVAE